VPSLPLQRLRLALLSRWPRRSCAGRLKRDKTVTPGAMPGCAARCRFRARWCAQAPRPALQVHLLSRREAALAREGPCATRRERHRPRLSPRVRRLRRGPTAPRRLGAGAPVFNFEPFVRDAVDPFAAGQHTFLPERGLVFAHFRDSRLLICIAPSRPRSPSGLTTAL
jgi:hypothetical protein